jgi:5-bromo-4-chloroindolyl phosphate hydrolysis protein
VTLLIYFLDMTIKNEQGIYIALVCKINGATKHAAKRLFVRKQKLDKTDYKLLKQKTDGTTRKKICRSE